MEDIVAAGNDNEIFDCLQEILRGQSTMSLFLSIPSGNYVDIFIFFKPRFLNLFKSFLPPCHYNMRDWNFIEGAISKIVSI